MDPYPPIGRQERTALLGKTQVEISAHAVVRFQERVNRTLPRQLACASIAEMLAHGCVRARGRKWTDIDPAPGTRLVYCALQPDACLIVKNRTVVTVITRELCARRRRAFIDAPTQKASRPGSRRRATNEADWRLELVAA